MLSILIPTYNYNCLPLVSELHEQATVLNIVFEIICLDDCSDNKTILQQNKGINALEHCTFSRNTTNLGRAANRNKLAQLAIFEWLLFLDGDMQPCSNSFIRNYTDAINKISENVFYGGIAYKNQKLNKQQKLRHTYGLKREAISFKNREKEPYKHTLTSNLLIHKKIVAAHPFEADIKTYGYEDLVFIHQLEQNKIEIKQLNNACFHLNLESSELFIKKCKTAMENLILIEKKNIIPAGFTKIQKAYLLLNKFNLVKLFSLIYKLGSKLIEIQLTSNKPKIKLLDVYKLSYYCHLKTK